MVELFTDFDTKFAELSADDFEHRTAFFGDGVAAGGFGAAFVIGGRGEPATFFHSLQQRVERAWTDIITMMTELFEHPVANQLSFGGMVQNMYFPEGE